MGRGGRTLERLLVIMIVSRNVADLLAFGSKNGRLEV